MINITSLNITTNISFQVLMLKLSSEQAKKQRTKEEIKKRGKKKTD